MFEGKNIHFSPVDNKPLCSYSNKQCRQRRLNGYAFCIRHILEDKSAPFKQCEFVTRNNSQKCLNAIPVNQERGYCHSHMQVAGIIPKTERKPKLSNSSNGSLTVPRDLNGSCESSNGKTTVTGKEKQGVQERLPIHAVSDAKLIKKTDSNADTKLQILGPVTINSAAKPGSKGKCRSVSSGKQQEPKSGKVSGGLSTLRSVQSSDGTKKNEVTSLQPVADRNAAKKDAKKKVGGKGSEASKSSKQKKVNAATEAAVSKNEDASVKSAELRTTLCVRDNWRKFNFITDLTSSNSSTKLEQMKSIRALEKLPLFTETINETDIASSFKESRVMRPKYVSLGIEALLTPPFLGKPVTVVRPGERSHIIEEECSILDESDGLVKKIKIETERVPDASDEKELVQLENETRQEFLARVRKMVRRQYKTIRKACKFNSKEDRDDKAFRNALLSCALQDSSLCAKILQTREYEQNMQELAVLGASAGEKSHIKNTKATILRNNVSASVKANGISSITKPVKPSSTPAKYSITDSEEDHSVVSDSCKTKFVNRDSANCMWTNISSARSASAIHKKGIAKAAKANGTLRNLNNTTADGGPAKSQNKIGVSKTKSETQPNSNGVTNRPSVNKKRKIESSSKVSADCTNSKLSVSSQSSTAPSLSFNGSRSEKHGCDSLSDDTHLTSNYEAVLNSVSSSEAATTPEGMMTDGSFDSPFDNSTSSHPDCDFSDDDLERSFELPEFPEIAHQASRLLEDTGFTEDDFDELFHSSDSKLNGRSDLNDLGIDFNTNFDASDIDYSLFGSIFPPFRSSQAESISVNNQF